MDRWHGGEWGPPGARAARGPRAAGGPRGSWEGNGRPPGPSWLPAVPLGILAGLVQVGGSLGRARLEGEQVTWLGVLLLLAGPLAIITLHRVPLLPLAVATTASAAYALLGYPLGPVVAAPVAALVVEGVRRRREQWAALREARRTQEDRRRSDERMAVARDLHDSVGHSLTLISVQSAAALHTLDRDPENARQALTTVRAESQRALAEVRRVLDALRDPASEAATRPAPGVADLADLVAADPGFDWRLELDDDPSPVPPAVGAAVYRVVQEAMTNVRRHSGATTARIALRHDDAGVEVTVEDHGGAPDESRTPADGARPGTGLVGMQERVASVGGHLEAGPRAAGGWRVAATFPVDAGAGGRS
jgi:signal transduction histidine kinase